MLIAPKPVRNCTQFENNSAASFRPSFAHQIFETDKFIFGYKDLKIRMYYTAANLNIYFDTEYSAQTSGWKADDVKRSVLKLLTTSDGNTIHCTNIDGFRSEIDKEAKFVPFGEKRHSWKVEQDGGERKLGIYECNSNAPGFLDFHTRLQTFFAWLVDAPTYIATFRICFVLFPFFRLMLNAFEFNVLFCYEKHSSEGKTMFATVATRIFVCTTCVRNIYGHKFFV